MTERGDSPDRATPPPPPATPGEPRPPEQPGTRPEPPVPGEAPAAPVPSPASAAAPAPSQPLVAWEAPAPPYPPAGVGSAAGGYAGGAPAFSIGALLSDSFARYGADPIRLFVIAIVATTLSFLGTYLSLPFSGAPFGFASDSSGLVGLMSFVVGIVTSATVFALAEGGAEMPFGRVFRRGVERSGWLFLTSLLVGLGFVFGFLLASIPVLLLAVMDPLIASVPFVVLVLVFIWIGLRLALAAPATVVDNLNSIEAIRMSWRATRPSGVWARILAASLLLGLLFLPGSAGGLLLLLLAMLNGQPILLLVVSMLFAFVTPLISLVTYSAYRRLVAPIEPSWAAPLVSQPSPSIAAAGIAQPPPVGAAEATSRFPAADAGGSVAPADLPPAAAEAIAPARPAATFHVPPFDLAAKAILALVLAVDVAGIAAIPYVIGEFAAGRVTIPRFPTGPGDFPGMPGLDGVVVPGTVAFGTSADLSTCEVEGQAFSLPASGPIVWVAEFDHSLAWGEEVTVRVSRDGEPLDDTRWGAATGRCIGADQPVEGMLPGIYFYEVEVNGRFEAGGTLIVR